MRIHHLATTAAGLAVVALTLGALALPAGADTEDAEVRGGTMDLYDEFADFIDQVDLDPSRVDCSAPASSMTMTGTATSGSWSVDLNLDIAVNVLGSNFRLVMSIDLAGTYAGSALTGSGSVTADARWSTGPGDCAVHSSYGPCRIEAVNIVVSGSHTVDVPDDILDEDTFTVSGGNTPGNFETQITGDPDDCGSLIALHNGGISFADLQSTAVD